jgi:ABC-2 type transport system permease protein
VRTSLKGISAAFEMHMRLYGTHPYRIFQVMILPALMSILAVLVLRSRGADVGFYRVAIGAGLVGVWASVMGAATFTIAREREWYGTFELLTGVPTPLPAIFAGYLLADTVSALVAVPISFGIAAAFMHGDVVAPSGFGLAGSLVVTTIAMFALAILFAPVMALVPVLTRWVNALEYPVWIFGGFFFPIALLPGWTSPFSYGLSAYWAGESLHRAAGDASVSALLPLWAKGVGLSVVYIALAVAFFGVAIRRLKRTAALTYGG